ncbi:hypothetical protein ACFL49_03165 [Candidatus Omnitrophota bacterium]
MKRYYLNFAIFSVSFCSCLMFVQPVMGSPTDNATQTITEDIEQQASALYEDAVNSIKDEEYVTAKEKFLKLNKIYPNYKSTEKYLDLVEEQIAEAQSYAERLKALETRKAEREEREGQLKADVGTIYDDALKLYKDEDYEGAKAKFEEAELVYPGYKATAYYLSQIDNDIEVKELKVLEEERKRQEAALKEKAKQIYKEGLKFYKQRKYDFAKLRFLEVHEIIPGYKSVEKYLAKLDEKILEEEVRLKKELQEAFEKKFAQEESEKRLEQERKIKARADVIFNEASILYNQKEYERAQTKFEELNEVIDNYK